MTSHMVALVHELNVEATVAEILAAPVSSTHTLNRTSSAQ